MNFIKKNVPGMLLCLLIAIPAWYLGKLFPVVGGPVLAILIGLWSRMVPRRPALQSGIGFTSKKVLQYAIVLLGFDMNLFHILQVGRQSLLIIVVTISTALIVAYLVSRLLHIPSKTAILIGVGSSICGGSAIAATAPVIDADDEDVAKSISTIFLFNVLAAFLFPAAGMALGMSDQGFGMWAGTAVNDTSSVVAAATTWSSAVGNDTTDAGYYRQTDPYAGYHSHHFHPGAVPFPKKKKKNPKATSAFLKFSLGLFCFSCWQRSSAPLPACLPLSASQLSASVNS